MPRNAVHRETHAMKRAKPLESLILNFRGRKVLIDADLATIYGVETRTLNQAVKRNAERFPEDFIFQLSAAEKSEVITNCDHLARLKFAKSLPFAFTEHGAIMAASVLNSREAVTMSVYVVRAFIRVREHLWSTRPFSSGWRRSTRRFWSTTPRCATSITNCCRCCAATARSTEAAHRLYSGPRMIALKGYQELVLDSLRKFFRQCSKDGRPEAAFQAVQLRNSSAPVPYIPVADGGVATGHALRLPAGADGRRQDAPRLLRSRARNGRVHARRACRGSVAGAEQYHSRPDCRSLVQWGLRLG